MNLLDKFSAVDIKAETRISNSDKQFCEVQQAAYNHGRNALKSIEGTYNYLKALWHIQKSLVCALIYTTSTPLEIGFDIANSWEYYSAFAGYSHLHIIKAACGLTGAPLSDFTINLISQVSTNITGIHGLVRRVGSDSFPPYFFSAKKWELTCKR